MYFSDKVALESLYNNSICVRTYEGIRMMKNTIDLQAENLVYVDILDKWDNQIITRGTMVRYAPVSVIMR